VKKCIFIYDHYIFNNVDFPKIITNLDCKKFYNVLKIKPFVYCDPEFEFRGNALIRLSVKDGIMFVDNLYSIRKITSMKKIIFFLRTHRKYINRSQ
jgi:hypothetical protein